MGRLEAAQVLLEHGVDANAQDADNAAPLHLASGFNPISWKRSDKPDHFGVVRLLLQYGADIHARDNKGRTPFMVATEDRNRSIMQLLLENGAEDHRK
jgi:ankyrin repeat protein